MQMNFTHTTETIRLKQMKQETCKSQNDHPRVVLIILIFEFLDL